jgi:hypothetical protein
MGPFVYQTVSTSRADATGVAEQDDLQKNRRIDGRSPGLIVRVAFFENGAVDSTVDQMIDRVFGASSFEAARPVPPAASTPAVASTLGKMTYPRMVFDPVLPISEASLYGVQVAKKKRKMPRS